MKTPKSVSSGTIPVDIEFTGECAQKIVEWWHRPKTIETVISVPRGYWTRLEHKYFYESAPYTFFGRERADVILSHMIEEILGPYPCDLEYKHSAFLNDRVKLYCETSDLEGWYEMCLSATHIRLADSNV